MRTRARYVRPIFSALDGTVIVGSKLASSALSQAGSISKSFGEVGSNFGAPGAVTSATLQRIAPNVPLPCGSLKSLDWKWRASMGYPAGPVERIVGVAGIAESALRLWSMYWPRDTT
jgi:hypothetical protein